MQDIVVGLFIVACIALQYLMGFERVFECHERLFRLVLCADKEDERFFLCEPQIILHPPDAVMQSFTLFNEVGGRFSDHADKGASLVMLQREILFGNFGKLLHEFLLFVGFLDRLLLRILIDA